MATEKQLAFDWEEIERARYEPTSIFENATLERLTGLPEGQHFDRKRARVDAKRLAESVCAFSNADARGGVIAVGFDGPRFEGFAAVGEAKLNELLQATDDFCVHARVKSKTVRFADGTAMLVLVEYNPDRVVELTDGSVFVRVGDSNRRLTGEEIAYLRDDKGEVSFETTEAEGLTMGELDPGLVGQFAKSVREQNALQFDRSAEDILVQRRLASYRSGRYVPRYAAVLLFARDPLQVFPGCKVRFIRYEGTEERTGAQLNVVKDVSIEGPIPQAIAQAFDTVSSQLREFQALQPDGRFRLIPEYPPDCVQEAIVNACVHRSYAMRNANVFVRMFDDRLEVESPGGFVPPVTPETVYDLHMPRNPFLMDALRYMRIVRCANEGARRMRHLMKQFDLPAPVFRQELSPKAKVLVQLKNDIQQRRTWIDRDLTAFIGERLAASLSAAEKRVLNYLAERGQMTVSDAWRITTVKTWHSARKIMDRLLEKRLVREVKTMPRDPKAHFVLAEQWAPRASPDTA